ncbi:MAG: response regulator [Myxococcales bacterium]|nr:response regulator [Myxococcales bacterium]
MRDTPEEATREEAARLRAEVDRLQGQVRALTAQARQQGELEARNAALEARAAALTRSEARLAAQREELRVANAELERQTRALMDDQSEVDARNRELRRAGAVLQQRAAALEAASRSKSTFLANMSHELRTPLNSVLILSKLLADDATGNLTAKQVDFARTIRRAGQDLLRLIDEVLDLAKIEAGRVEVVPEPVNLGRWLDDVGATFAPQAATKGLELTWSAAPGAPRVVRTDPHRLGQIVRNLIANALKFTEDGEVIVLAAPAATPGPDGAAWWTLTVADTGIGIAADRQAEVFEAFRQADEGTARRFGGTGLGLAIARQLAELLGGTLGLTSAPGEGTTCTLSLPVDTPVHRADSAPPAPRRAAEPPLAAARDDRDSIRPGDRVLLVVEDDPGFARGLVQLGQARGLRVVVARDGAAALRLAATLRLCGVVLDVGLPDMDGWAVLRALREQPGCHDVPVHLVSAHAATPGAAEAAGAVGYLEKPVDAEAIHALLSTLLAHTARRPRRVLVVEDDAALRDQLAALLAGPGITIDAVGDADAALAALDRHPPDCAVVDLGLPGALTGLDLITTLRGRPDAHLMPVVVYTGRDLEGDDLRSVHRHAEALILKGPRSDERLLDEVLLFLGRLERSPGAEREGPPDLGGRTALVVDDDVRNLYVLAEVLESAGVRVIEADDGHAALDLLAERDDVDVVLLDMMMPTLDGYGVLARLRADPRHARLPVIAVTARAMPGDRQRCLDAGADAYVSKPVDTARLWAALGQVLEAGS